MRRPHLEPGEKGHCEQVDEATKLTPDPELRTSKRAEPVMHDHIAHSESAPARQHQNETIEFAIERGPFD
jgi:hypothetical protein